MEDTTQGSDQQNHLLGQIPSPEPQWTVIYMTNHATGNSSPWQDSSCLNHWGTPEEATGSGAYWQSQDTDMEDDSGTETDTSSDSGHEEIDMRIGNIDCTSANGEDYQVSLLASSGAYTSASEQQKEKEHVFLDMP